MKLSIHNQHVSSCIRCVSIHINDDALARLLSTGMLCMEIEFDQSFYLYVSLSLVSKDESVIEVVLLLLFYKT